MLIRKVRRIFLKDVVVCCFRSLSQTRMRTLKGQQHFVVYALFDSPKSYNYYISHRAQLFKTHRRVNGSLSHGHPPRGRVFVVTSC